MPIDGENQIIVRPADAPGLIERAAPALSPEELLVKQWLFDRTPHTLRSYRGDYRIFREIIPSPLHEVTRGDLQQFILELRNRGLAESSIATTISSIKSLFKFAQAIGFMQFNVAASIKLGKRGPKLHERICSETDVERIIAAAKPGRDRTMLELLYVAALRRDELAQLRACDLTPRTDEAGNETGQITVMGKGAKPGHVMLPPYMWLALLSLIPNGIAGVTGFTDDGGGRRLFGVSASQVWRIFKIAACKAGLPDVSPHFFRHGHATHALERGADLKLIQSTLRHANISTTGEYLHARPKASSGTYLKRMTRF
jgi:site-specific recombinase XerD